ncbi:MAG: hypothetical protein WA003_15695 [Desulfuromonadaceae bacterium]
MKANINEVSGNAAEVTLDGDGWHAVVTANIALDEGLYEVVLDSWIALTDEIKIWVPSALISGKETEIAVNEALAAYYEADAEATKINELED